MLIDSHAHLNFKEFENDWQGVIAGCFKDGVNLINVGSQFATSQKAVAMADKYDQGVYAAVGLHPIHSLGSSFHPEEFVEKDFIGLIKSSPKVVAIGETGLDFFHDANNLVSQKKVFISHLNLAREFNLPVILHARNSKDGGKDAYEEILGILRDQEAKEPASASQQAQGFGVARGVIHCFGGTLEQAKKFLELGFYIGFTGIITFSKTENLAEVIKSIPLERILIETDSPYLAPAPHRGQRNLPNYVRFVAEKIAEIRQISYNEVEDQTKKNAYNLFNLPH